MIDDPVAFALRDPVSLGLGLLAAIAILAEAVTAAMLRKIADAAQRSFLAVLKTFGNVPSPGLLSFPTKGTTLALDFANRGPSTFALLDKLDGIVREAGGRLYPAKDGRLPKAMFQAGYPALRLYAAEGAMLGISGRNIGRLVGIADDLRVRGAIQVETFEVDFTTAAVPSTLAAMADKLGGLDHVHSGLRGLG